MNAQLAQPIAFGRTAEVYAWQPGQVLKLFYDWFKLEDIEHEAQVSRAIHASGLPVPAVGEIVHLKNRFGLVYQRINGESMFTHLQRQPWNLFRFSKRMAELQLQIHNSKIQAELPLQRQQLEMNICQADSLPDPLKLKAIAALHTLPDRDQLCHGDFWPGNILIAPQGEMIIDWYRACQGNPLADLARTTNLVICFAKTNQVRRPFHSNAKHKNSSIKNSLFKQFCRLCYPTYLKYYFRLCRFNRDEYKRWLPIVAAARLSDNIPELENILIAQVENYL